MEFLQKYRDFHEENAWTIGFIAEKLASRNDDATQKNYRVLKTWVFGQYHLGKRLMINCDKITVFKYGIFLSCN